jgi:formate hydrogenlyase subunit 5
VSQFADIVAARTQPASNRTGSHRTGSHRTDGERTERDRRPEGNGPRQEGRFAGLFGSALADGSVNLRAAVARYGELDVVSCVVPPAPDGRPGTYKALTPSVPAAAWYEREIVDLFGLVPKGHPRIDPLVLPLRPGETRPRPGLVGRGLVGRGPVGRGLVGRGRPNVAPTTPIVVDETPLPAHLAGEGVFTLPYGPVRSGVFESVQFLVETPGEDIPHLRTRVYHKHRGIETRFEGMSPADGVLVAERTEGVASVAHAMAFSQAIESLSPTPVGAGEVGDSVPRPAMLLRVVHAELERVANHLDSTIRHTEAAGQAVAYSRLTWHKERIMRLRAELCGHRFGRGVVVPGGVTGPPAVAPSHALNQLARIEASVRADLHLLMATSSFVDRLRRTGVLSPEVARSRGALGPVGRASGLDEDVRFYRPYGAYRFIEMPEHRYRDSADALGRQLVRNEEMWGAFELCRLSIKQLGQRPPEGPWAVPIVPADGTAWGWVEAPQGELLYMVDVEGGRLRRVKPRSASFHNLSLFPDAFTGDIFTDFAFIEASFGVSVAGVAN